VWKNKNEGGVVSDTAKGELVVEKRRGGKRRQPCLCLCVCAWVSLYIKGIEKPTVRQTMHHASSSLHTPSTNSHQLLAPHSSLSSTHIS
jgi:hypothetical protein